MKINLKKHWSTIVFALAIVLLLHPISKAYVLRLIAFSPTELKESKQNKLRSYEWKLKGLTTDDLDFANLQGKVIFVNFWATWCPPCVAEMPAIQEMYDTYKNDIAFVFVTNDKKGVVTEFFTKHNYQLPVYKIYSAPPEVLNTTNVIPTTYVVDKNGTIRILKTGAVKWNSKKSYALLDGLLAE